MHRCPVCDAWCWCSPNDDEPLCLHVCPESDEPIGYHRVDEPAEPNERGERAAIEASLVARLFPRD